MDRKWVWSSHLILHIVSRGIIMAAVSKFMSEALPSRSCTFCGKAYSHSSSLSRQVKDVHEKENDATIACNEKDCTNK